MNTCLWLRSSSIDHLTSCDVWIKILIIWAANTLVLTTSREQPCWWLCILYLCSYSAIDQVSAYSSNNWIRVILTTNILTSIFLCDIFVTVRTQDSLRTRIYEKRRPLRAGYIARKQFLAKRYFKLIRRLFFELKSTIHLKVFVLKLLNMFCIPMLLHIKLDRGLLMTVRVLKAENCVRSLHVFWNRGEISMQNFNNL